MGWGNEKGSVPLITEELLLPQFSAFLQVLAASEVAEGYQIVFSVEWGDRVSPPFANVFVFLHAKAVLFESNDLQWF